MPLIQVPQSVMPCQVDVPDSIKDRSRPGSIHFKPGVRRVTAEEWEHVKKAHPALAKQCVVVPVDETQTKGAKAKAEEQKKAAANAPKPMLDKRAKDAPTRRQRKLAELEAKKAGGGDKATAKSAGVVVPPPPPPAEESKGKPDKKTTK